MLRRIVTTATASAAALTALTAFAGASVAAAHPLLPPLPLPPLLGGELAGEDRLTVVVSETGNARTDGRYELECGPAGAVGGNHPAADAACDRLDELARGTEDPFAPVDRGVFCTQQAGGPATARVTGVWQGHRVDASFSRQNGCEIHRWNNLTPVLPSAGA